MKNKNLFLVFITSLIIAFFINACSKSGTASQPPAGGGNTATVNISGMAFPATTTVKIGVTVSWYNKDGVPHTVTSNDGSSFNGSVAAGANFTYQANTVGTFPYHCNIHPGMTATLVVNP